MGSPGTAPISSSGWPFSRTRPSVASTSARPIPSRRRSGRTTAILSSDEAYPTSSSPSNAPTNCAGSTPTTFITNVPSGSDDARISCASTARAISRPSASRSVEASARTVTPPGSGPAVASALGRRSGAARHADELQPHLGVLGGIRLRRRLEHEVRPGLRLGERHDLADVRLVRKQRRPAVDAKCDPAVRRCAVLERVEDRPELLAHPVLGLALEREAQREQLPPMNPDGPAAQLPAVERDVVLERPG